MQTKQAIEYRKPWGVGSFTIPKGVKVNPASNLPNSCGYWAESWDGMTEEEESHQRNYGFLVFPDELMP